MVTKADRLFERNADWFDCAVVLMFLSLCRQVGRNYNSSSFLSHFTGCSLASFIPCWFGLRPIIWLVQSSSVSLIAFFSFCFYVRISFLHVGLRTVVRFHIWVLSWSVDSTEMNKNRYYNNHKNDDQDNGPPVLTCKIGPSLTAEQPRDDFEQESFFYKRPAPMEHVTVAFIIGANVTLPHIQKRGPLLWIELADWLTFSRALTFAANNTILLIFVWNISFSTRTRFVAQRRTSTTYTMSVQTWFRVVWA